jgi:ribonuclease PH
VEQGILTRVPLRDAVAAISVGVVDGEAVLDLPYEEDSRAEVDMNIVCTGSGRFVEVQGTGEEETFSREQLDAMIALAQKGIQRLVEHQNAALADASGT